MNGPFAQPLPGSLDLVWRLFGPLHARLAVGLAALGLPTMAADALVEIVMWVEFAAVGLAVTHVARRLRAGERVPGSAAVAAAVIALALLAWTWRHPGANNYEMFLRPDHLLFAGAAGLALDRLPGVARRLLLTAISALILTWFHGPLALAVVGGGGLVGLGAACWLGRGRRAGLVVSQAVVVIAVLAVCFWIHRRDAALALAVFGLAFFVLMRHVSWVAAFAGGAAVNVVDYAYYLLFYPGASGLIGAPEVFAEFGPRNLGQPVRPDAQLWSRLVRGAVYVWLSRRIPVSLEAVTASTSTIGAWTLQAIYYVEVALSLMGLWSMVDGVALLLGVRLRQNFAHLLDCENPSDLWRSVRGTMTFWLVYHVYRPLGGNRMRQELHVLAALGVSLAWHLVGVPFIARPVTALHFAPFTLWAVINAAALTGHVSARRRRWSVLPDATPVWLRRGLHRLLTILLASLAVTLPSFQMGGKIDGFMTFVGTLAGR